MIFMSLIICTNHNDVPLFHCSLKFNFRIPWLEMELGGDIIQKTYKFNRFKGITRGPKALQSHLNDFHHASVLCWP